MGRPSDLEQIVVELTPRQRQVYGIARTSRTLPDNEDKPDGNEGYAQLMKANVPDRSQRRMYFLLYVLSDPDGIKRGPQRTETTYPSSQC